MDEAEKEIVKKRGDSIDKKIEHLKWWAKQTPTNKLLIFLFVGIIFSVTTKYFAVENRYDDMKDNFQHERRKNEECEETNKRIVLEILRKEKKDKLSDSIYSLKTQHND